MEEDNRMLLALTLGAIVGAYTSMLSPTFPDKLIIKEPRTEYFMGRPYQTEKVIEAYTTTDMIFFNKKDTLTYYSQDDSTFINPNNIK